VFNLTGVTSPPFGITTKNEASTYVGPYNYNSQSNSSFAATTFTLTTGLSASWSATSDTSGFVTTLLAPATQGYGSFIQTVRSFTVTGTQQITLNWSGSETINFSKYTGTAWAAAIPAGSGWSNYTYGTTPGSSNASLSGTLTTTLSAGTYWLSNVLRNQQGASFSFALPAVPAPGALALLGVAGIVGARRRRA
jgi:MYXO-CTERM domain-containing protein